VNRTVVAPGGGHLPDAWVTLRGNSQVGSPVCCRRAGYTGTSSSFRYHSAGASPIQTPFRVEAVSRGSLNKGKTRSSVLSVRQQ
jgi:hypothetical protein